MGREEKRNNKIEWKKKRIEDKDKENEGRGVREGLARTCLRQHSLSGTI